jgi:hypothetical protein
MQTQQQTRHTTDFVATQLEYPTPRRATAREHVTAEVAVAEP